jgi:hypothetical protein
MSGLKSGVHDGGRQRALGWGERLLLYRICCLFIPGEVLEKGTCGEADLSGLTHLINP